MEQVFVPAGDFLMGYEDLYLPPVHTVYLDAYWIDKTEITNAMFTQFVSETRYWTEAEKNGKGYILTTSGYIKTYGASWEHPQGLSSDIQSKEQWPVTQVSWNDAAAYCAWAGKRLPTEAEWEKAARGTDGRKYPWGNDAPGCLLANIDKGKDIFCVGEAVEVGSYPSGISPYGALDMIGNLWEWVYDWSGPEIHGHQKNPTGPNTGNYRIMRGGGWNLNGFYSLLQPNFSADISGFRCVSPEPAGH